MICPGVLHGSRSLPRFVQHFLGIGVVVHLQEIDIIPGIGEADAAIDETFVAISPDQTDKFVTSFGGDVVVPAPGVEPKQVGIVFLDQFPYLRKGFPLPVFLKILVRPPGVPFRDSPVRIFPILPMRIIESIFKAVFLAGRHQRGDQVLLVGCSGDIEI